MNKGNFIENKSFEIIEKNVNLAHFNESEKLIIKKLIHTTGDYQFADITIISKSAIEVGIRAISENLPIVCDTMMVKS
ncbi:MAG: precorrin-8X methylmutase, partial [Deferribacterota bacterium]|nr:precorrin-8X methylmutase [Deferribacterota bacterium]